MPYNFFVIDGVQKVPTWRISLQNSFRALPSRSIIDLCRSVWKTLEDFGRLWKCLEEFGSIWKSLEEFGSVWKCLEEFGFGRVFESWNYNLDCFLLAQILKYHWKSLEEMLASIKGKIIYIGRVWRRFPQITFLEDPGHDLRIDWPKIGKSHLLRDFGRVRRVGNSESWRQFSNHDRSLPKSDLWKSLPNSSNADDFWFLLTATSLLNSSNNLFQIYSKMLQLLQKDTFPEFPTLRNLSKISNEIFLFLAKLFQNHDQSLPKSDLWKSLPNSSNIDDSSFLLTPTSLPNSSNNSSYIKDFSFLLIPNPFQTLPRISSKFLP